MHATDFSDAALDQLRLDAQQEGLDDRVTAALHDVRDPLPPADATVGAVYANLLLNMALSRAELRSLMHEIRRVLRPGGLFVYSVWSTEDPCHGRGAELGDGLLDKRGLVCRFFDRELIHELADRWELRDVELYHEGPRQLWRITQAKGGTAA